MSTQDQQESTSTATLSPAAEMLLEAIDRELPDIIPRHKINKLSPSFPLSKRTLANRDSISRRETGRPYVEQTDIGGRRFLIKSSLLSVMRVELSKVKDQREKI